MKTTNSPQNAELELERATTRERGARATATTRQRGARQKPYLSKSRFLLGAQCHRLLWLKAHEPDAEELKHDAGTELILKQGHLVGEEARRRFAGGVLVDLPHDQVEERIRKTRELIDAGTEIIFEASFRHHGVFVAVDVLRRLDEGWDLIEVKSSTKVKNEHLLDVAVQRHVLGGAGLDVRRVSLMHLSRECVYPDLDNLFELADLTEAAIDLEPSIKSEITAQREALAGDLPDVETGDHCEEPRPCPFHDRCHEELPAHHVTTLYAIGKKAKVLLDDGYKVIEDVDENRVKLSAVCQRQVRSVKAKALVVEPGLKDALKSIDGPVAFLDFETIGFAIPRYSGARPWDQIAAQASVHIEMPAVDGDCDLEHRACLADGSLDPRGQIGEFVIDAVREAKTILAWNASFERRCVEAIAESCPDLKEELESVAARLVDLLPIVRNHVYHPDFGGSFSLKSVAPALAPSIKYDELDVDGGHNASAALFRLFTDASLAETERDHAERRLDFPTDDNYFSRSLSAS